MLPFLDSFLPAEIDPTLVTVLNWVVFVHVFAVVCYFLLLAKDLLTADNEHIYPYKATEAALRKNKTE